MRTVSDSFRWTNEPGDVQVHNLVNVIVPFKRREMKHRTQENAWGRQEWELDRSAKHFGYPSFKWSYKLVLRDFAVLVMHTDSLAHLLVREIFALNT